MLQKSVNLCEEFLNSINSKLFFVRRCLPYFVCCKNNVNLLLINRRHMICGQVSF